MNGQNHESVLLEEALTALNIQPNGNYVDATYGRGGHASEILSLLGTQGRLLAIDRDPDAVAAAQRNHKDPRFQVEHGPFSRLAEIVDDHKLTGRVDGVLFDLGVSSPQLDIPNRGFSFNLSGPLDMRMDTTTGITAAEWLNNVDEQSLVAVIKQYGEERYAKRIARAIVKKRLEQPVLTTKQLADIVGQAVPTREPGKHPATRTFQAIRIYINHELEELDEALQQTLEVLSLGGRLVVISFHSLEDRITKKFMQKETKGDHYPVGLPIKDSDLKPRLKIIGKQIRPDESEIQRNPRSRSAVMRVAERTEKTE